MQIGSSLRLRRRLLAASQAGSMSQQKVTAKCLSQRSRCSSSSGSDDEFEECSSRDCCAFELDAPAAFLSRLRTPTSATRRTPRTQTSGLKASKEVFLSYLTDKYGSGRKGPKVPLPSGGEVPRSGSCLPPLAFTDSDGDDSAFAKTPHPPVPRSHHKRSWTHVQPTSSLQEEEEPAASWDPFPREEGGRTLGKDLPQDQAQRLKPRLGSDSSDEEIRSLAVCFKQRLVFPTSQSVPDQRDLTGMRSLTAVSCESIPIAMKKEMHPNEPLPKEPVLRDITHQTSSSCQVQGCFLQELSDPESQRAKHFRHKKVELAQTLYAFFNCSVFEEKLPQTMEINWSKKMLTTAGFCINSSLKGQRCAQIKLSEKVCDSAERLRDTLIHEMCHAAVWLLHGHEENHGPFWRVYAQKSVLLHPELPVVSRCHNYEIKCKFTYECLQCKATIGRHSKSLDTRQSVCCHCKGQLVLRQPMRKGSTSAQAPLTPFAQYVKENYGPVKRSLPALSHGALMKQLSANFAAQGK